MSRRAWERVIHAAKSCSPCTRASSSFPFRSVTTPLNVAGTVFSLHKCTTSTARSCTDACTSATWPMPPRCSQEFLNRWRAVRKTPPGVKDMSKSYNRHFLIVEKLSCKAYHTSITQEGRISQRSELSSILASTAKAFVWRYGKVELHPHADLLQLTSAPPIHQTLQDGLRERPKKLT